jgi:hypothetical protein
MQGKHTDTELAWAAGLFEGEGSIIHYSTPSGKKSRMLQLETTDADVLQRFHAIVGVGQIRGPRIREAGRKPIWLWQCSKGLDYLPLLNTLMPWLGERRRAKAEQLLADPPKLEPQTHCKRGHLLGMNRKFRGCQDCRHLHYLAQRNPFIKRGLKAL